MRKDPEFLLYFDDSSKSNRLPDRTYFFNVMHTLYPDYLNSIMNHAINERYGIDGEK